MENDLKKASISTGTDDDLKKKNMSTSIDNENQDEDLSNLKRLKDGYVSIVDKMGYGKFKPYLQRLFHAVEIMFLNEVTEFKKIDAKYQDMVRQCHIYEKTLTMLKENQCNEFQTFNDSSNTYAIDDFTKVTPYLAPDLLQSTIGAANIVGGSTSLQFRLPARRSSISNRQYVSTPLGPTRSAKRAVPLAHFDDESSFVSTTSFGFQQQSQVEKQFVDAFTEPESLVAIEKKDFSCQIAPLYNDKEVETTHLVFDYQSTQTDSISTETIACQVNPDLDERSVQTILNELADFSCQFNPTTLDQIIETMRTDFHVQTVQTDSIPTEDYGCQITPEYTDQQTETTPISTNDVALQSSFLISTTFDDRQCQTDRVFHADSSTQYELDEDVADRVILPILLSEELPVSNEIEISIDNQLIQIDSRSFVDEECQTIENIPCLYNESTQTPGIFLKDCATQSSMVTVEDQQNQTEPVYNRYSSSLYIVPTPVNQSKCSSRLVVLPKESSTPRAATLVDREVQCDWCSLDTEIPIMIEHEVEKPDRKSILQRQLGEKEKQMNRIIEEYASLYGEYETERRRNMDLIETRDRLADHIKVLSDELGDREINQEKLLIKSCQQSKLINYMLPQIDCSPMPKKMQKKHHSTTTFRRLLPKFK